MSASVFRAFVVCSPGLESMLSAELEGLGARADVERGGVEIAGPRELLWAIHRESRLAESVRIRLKPFTAKSFEELENGLSRLPWHAYVRRDETAALRIDVTCHHSRLYHSDAVAERVQRVIATRLAGSTTIASGSNGELAPPRIFVRIVRDRVEVSVDASGERLHRRGYRTHVGRAPLRETLAAALAMMLERVSSGSTAGVWDPFCGSGTLLIEWLALEAGIPPGAQRRFAYEHWPLHDAEAHARWISEHDKTRPSSELAGARVFGSDVSEAAIATATSNAERAQLLSACRFWAEDFRTAVEQVPIGTRILTNPPYGVRMGRGRTRELSSALDALLTARRDLRPAIVLSGDPEFAKGSRLAWHVELAFKSGGLPVRAISLKS